MKSWKTTALAIITLVITAGTIAKGLISGDPGSAVNWSTAIPTIMTAIGLIFAKDHSADASK